MQISLWNEGRDEWTLAGDNSLARSTGLSPRPLVETVSDTLAWLRGPGISPPDSWGLTSEREAELLQLWHQEHG